MVWATWRVVLTMMKSRHNLFRIPQLAIIFLMLSTVVFGAQAKRRHHAMHHAVRHAAVAVHRAASPASQLIHTAAYVPHGPVVRGSGFQPCSTIKVSVALAALSEKVVGRDGKLWRRGYNLTQALAHSNNFYFATLGLKLGFDKVSYYAHLFGYGEKAGLNIAGENPGRFPSAPPKNGGVGMLTSFGEEIAQTPLQLAALMSALANGGTLYYLQYPRSAEDVSGFVPQVKHQLDIQSLIPQIKPGMLAAVEYGTARRAQQDEAIAGKTGTCTDSHTHLGWFGSFNDAGKNKLVVVVLLTGGRPAIGPMAAGVAGEVYRNLAQKNYFAASRPIAPATLISTQICCAR
jgi:penicillin-binding protein 2